MPVLPQLNFAPEVGHNLSENAGKFKAVTGQAGDKTNPRVIRVAGDNEVLIG